jgi:DHA1 family bicyclomycin/chloramphenicol resistance-like MFS transporter
VLGALTAFPPVSVDLYLPAFPDLADHFATSTGTVALSLSTYLVGVAAGQLVYGRLSDTYGRRPPMVVGIALYIGASVACAFAPSVGALIGLRLVQGLGACAGVVIARAIVRDLYDGAEAARFYSLLMLVFGVAPVVAPLVGAGILAVAGWRAIFVTLALYGFACLLMVARLPETLPRERRRPAGLRDALRSYRQVLGDRAFLAYTGAIVFGSVALLAYIASSPALLIEEHGVSPQTFGLLFGANSLGFVAVSQVTSRVVGRVGPELVLRIGVAAHSLAAASLLGVALAAPGGLGALLPPLFVMVASLGAVWPTATALAMTPFPQSAGAASAVLGAGQIGGGAIAGAIVGAIALGPARSLALVAAVGAAASVAVLTLVAPGWRRQLAADE